MKRQTKTQNDPKYACSVPANDTHIIYGKYIKADNRILCHLITSHLFKPIVHTLYGYIWEKFFIRTYTFEVTPTQCFTCVTCGDKGLDLYIGKLSFELILSINDSRNLT